MEKNKWNDLDKPAKVEYIEEKLDRLKVVTDIFEKREIEKDLFEILTWQEEDDQ